MFVYTVQFVITLSKGTLMLRSQFVLYLTLFKFPLLTQYNKYTIEMFLFTTAMHVFYSRISYQNFSNNHNHLCYTFQIITNISQINHTVSSGQLTAIQCVKQ